PPSHPRWRSSSPPLPATSCPPPASSTPCCPSPPAPSPPRPCASSPSAPPPTSTPEPGVPVAPRRPGDPERLGPYRITGRLGQGGQGIVYLGHGPGSERVAVKTLTGALDRAADRGLGAARKGRDP